MPYIQIPGTKIHELPPLIVSSSSEEVEDTSVDLDNVIIQIEDMLPPVDDDPDKIEFQKFDLATSLAEQYRGLLARWQWGDSIIEWIRQCEITFKSETVLRSLLHPDVWPHASRSSFITLLSEKFVPVPAGPQQAVGLRLTFREPPPIRCCSNQFLFYLNSVVADSAYQTWAHLNPDGAALPPDRFHFEVLDVDRA